MAASSCQGYMLHSHPGRVAHLATIETKLSILTATSKKQPRNSNHHRGWDDPDRLELRMVAVSTLQTEWLAITTVPIQ